MTKLSADCSFHIGSQHLRSGLPCQDYAVSGAFAGGAYAVVSDGCSSGGRTDVAARLAAISIEQQYRCGKTDFSFTDWMAIANSFGLRGDDMLATVATVAVHDDRVQVKMIGDGAAAFVWDDGATSMVRTEWAGNVPWYPAYAYFDDGAEFLARHVEHGDKAFHIEHVKLRSGGVIDVASIDFPASLAIPGYIAAWPLAGLRCVAVFSDGVAQVEGVNWTDNVLELLAFRSTVGDFAKRRMNRFLRDRVPVDDIAMAAVLVEP
jgi:hypothetical protein